jgi:hypothetical protein
VSDIDQPAGAPEKSGISRRTVTKAMAWAVPVIAIASPVPAFASSGNVTINNVGACKSPGQGQNCPDWDKGYIVGFSVTNTHTHSIQITFTDLVMSAGIDGTWSLFNNVVVVAAGATEIVYIGLDNNGTSEQTSGSGTVDACYIGLGAGSGDPEVCLEDIPFAFSDTNPCVQQFGTNCPPKG